MPAKPAGSKHGNRHQNWAGIVENHRLVRELNRLGCSLQAACVAPANVRIRNIMASERDSQSTPVDLERHIFGRHVQDEVLPVQDE